jgi:hypothetical protein
MKKRIYFDFKARIFKKKIDYQNRFSSKVNFKNLFFFTIIDLDNQFFKW